MSVSNQQCAYLKRKTLPKAGQKCESILHNYFFKAKGKIWKKPHKDALNS